VFLFGSENTVKKRIRLQELQVRTIKAKLKVESGPLPVHFSSETTVKYTLKSSANITSICFKQAHYTELQQMVPTKIDNPTKYKIIAGPTSSPFTTEWLTYVPPAFTFINFWILFIEGTCLFRTFLKTNSNYSITTWTGTCNWPMVFSVR
jgi:hypothetical protein